MISGLLVSPTGRRPETIRRLIEIALKVKSKHQSSHGQK
jgi:hypothetical protein